MRILHLSYFCCQRTCSKAEKIFSKFFASIPTPLSLTVNLIYLFALAQDLTYVLAAVILRSILRLEVNLTCNVIRPLFVNLIAFASKLIIICLIFVESPEKNAGKFSSMLVWSLTFDFCWNSGDVTNSDECIISCKLTDSTANLTFPASICST
jgi:hypothetical protein